MSRTKTFSKIYSINCFFKTLMIICKNRLSSYFTVIFLWSKPGYPPRRAGTNPFELDRTATKFYLAKFKAVFTVILNDKKN